MDVFVLDRVFYHPVNVASDMNSGNVRVLYANPVPLAYSHQWILSTEDDLQS